MERRQFLQGIGASAGFWAVSGYWPQTFAGQPLTRLSYLSNRTVRFEGNFEITEIEGSLPADLNGVLYRVGPGTKNNYGTELKHLFDGDAFVTKLTIESGKIRGQSKFIETTERQNERQAGKMLYHEFGTPAPGKPLGFKNAPNVHVVKFGDKLLALSEAGWPVEIHPVTLETVGPWNFFGTLPKGVAMTAHPKIDPVTGDGYTFGITQGLGPELRVYKFEAATGKLTQITSIDLEQYHMIHDMMVTENYLVFLVPAITIDLMGAATFSAPIGQLLNYDPAAPFRIFVVRKDGAQEPVEISSSPGGTVFHHCNAWEEDGRLIFDSILMKDLQTFKLLESWSEITLPQVPPSLMTRFTVDIAAKSVVSREVLSDGQPMDFPCLPFEQIGKKHSQVIALEAELGTDDPICMNKIVRWDLNSGVAHRLHAIEHEIFGEVVYAGNFLASLGYNSKRDETFLDLRDPNSLELLARAWFGRYLPIGFHGSFIAN